MKKTWERKKQTTKKFPDVGQNEVPLPIEKLASQHDRGGGGEGLKKVLLGNRPVLIIVEPRGEKKYGREEKT